MSTIAISPASTGAAQFTIASPATATNRTITLPDATDTLVGVDATQTLTNKTINGGALTLSTNKASTSGTSIDFTSIPSWVKRLTVMFNGVSTSGTSIVQVQLGISSGVQTTGYNCVLSAVSGPNTCSIISAGTGALIGGSTAAGTRVGTLQFSAISTNVFAYSGVTADVAAIATSHTSGLVALSGTLDRVRITTVNGTDTFDSGSVNIMYEG